MGEAKAVASDVRRIKYVGIVNFILVRDLGYQGLPSLLLCEDLAVFRSDL